MHTIDDFLKYSDLTRYDIAKISGISETTLADANQRPVNKMTVKVVQAIAMGVGMTPGRT
ncbi:XRE family transcriptional regulator, partial [Lentilactobacillus parabuchneri]|nr:XRE family transcriptional regulator [Lentilactobacillus parabuchneri]